jgi:hypothetical protein
MTLLRSLSFIKTPACSVQQLGVWACLNDAFILFIFHAVHTKFRLVNFHKGKMSCMDNAYSRLYEAFGLFTITIEGVRDQDNLLNESI